MVTGIAVIMIMKQYRITVLDIKMLYSLFYTVIISIITILAIKLTNKNNGDRHKKKRPSFEPDCHSLLYE